VDEFISGFGVIAVASVQSLILQFLKFGRALALYGFGQLSNLNLKDGIQNVETLIPFFSALSPLTASIVSFSSYNSYWDSSQFDALAANKNFTMCKR
jgi:hypothetical protein